MPDGLVEEDARPSRTQDHGHLARRRLDGVELDRRLPDRLGREAPPAVFLEEEVERDAPASSVGADLALAVLLHDDGDVQPGQRADIAHREARGCRDEDDDVLAAQARDDLLDARVESAGRPVHLEEQRDLPVQGGRDGRLGQRVEIVGAAGPHGDGGGRRGLVRDGARLTGGLFQIGQGEIVGVGVACALAGLGADPGALAHMAGGLLDSPILECQLLADAVFEKEVGVVDAARQLGSQEPLHGGRGEAESVFEKSLRTRQHSNLRTTCFRVGEGLPS